VGKISDFLFKLEDKKVLAEVKKKLEAGTPPEKILDECKAAMAAFSEAFLQGKMFVSDLMIAAMIFEDINHLALPCLKVVAAGKHLGKVVIGTVKDDIHNIGKDFVSNMLLASGFEVIDAGVDVPAEDFVRAVREHNAGVLAMSCILTSSYNAIKATVDAIRQAGLRDKVKIIIGGGWVDDHVVRYTGADAFGANPQQCVRFCEEVYAANRD
jgi:methanogenic corrinoid protein MtbC1